MDALEEFVADIKAKRVAVPTDEAATKQGLILPILNHMGWQVFDTTEVVPEYSTAGRRVDYALHCAKEWVFVEVKKPAEDPDKHEEQLLEYAFKAAVDLAVLTNGTSWSFYLPRSKVRVSERKFYTVDLMQHEPADAARVLRDLLSRENVGSGRAIKTAEAMLKSRERDEAVCGALPKAWAQLVSGPDPLLVDVLNDAVEKVCGYRGEVRDLASFLRDLSGVPSGTLRTGAGIPVRKPRSGVTFRKARTSSGKRPVAFTLKGTRVTVRNWADLSVQLAKLLHSRHPEIFRQCLDLRTATALKTTIFTEGPPDEYRRSYREVPGSPYWVLTHGAGPGTFEERWKRIIERFGYNGTDLSLEIR